MTLLNQPKQKWTLFCFNSLFKCPLLITLYGFVDNVHKFQVVKRPDCLLLLLVFLLLLF